MDKTIRDLIDKNPEAGSLALGMELMSASSEQTHNIMNSLYEKALERIKVLENENAYLSIYARKYFTIRNALMPERDLDE